MAESRSPLKAAGKAVPARLRRRREGKGPSSGTLEPPKPQSTVDLQARRDQLNARLAELQWDLGGLVYEMAIRDRIRVDVLVRQAAVLQNVDAELGEVERILRLEETSTAGQCASCGAPHSAGAAYCWQCGQPLLQEVHTDQIGGPPTSAPPQPAPSSGDQAVTQRLPAL
jgi:hypothetical protein